MELIFSVLVISACLHFRCGAEVITTEEEIRVQSVIRKYIPTYLDSRVTGSRSGDPSGNGTSCGPPTSKLVFKWTPETIILGNPVSVSLQMVAPVDIDHGKGKATVYISGQSVPMLGFSFDGGCEDLKKRGVVGLSCPIKANDKINASYIVPGKSTRALIDGHFMLEIKIKNDKGEEFVCIRMDAYVKSGVV